jgi:uncharacterized protein YcaQ
MPAGRPNPALSLKASEARRVALAAQGFGARRSASVSPWPRAAAAVKRMQLLQIDSVSALVRAHYLPVFSRIGNYSRAALDRRAFAAKRRDYFEYWAHEASLLPLDLHPLMRWRMVRARDHVATRPWFTRFGEENRDYIRAVRDEIAAAGPVTVDALTDPGERTGPWWGWNRGKSAVEYLFRTGEVTTVGRRGFERVYDLAERAIPADILSLPTPAEPDAIRELARLSAIALGIGTEFDIRDYFRLPPAEFRTALHELVENGDLIPASVEGWDRTAFLARDAARPARLTPTALVSPFDPIVWFRPRTERLFDFHYRIEIYTPAHKRNFGYYVLPFLHRGRIVGRVDLRADRAAGILHVHGAFAEEGADVPAVTPDLAAELRHMAAWLDLADIRLARRGAFAAPLAKLIG